MNLSNKIIVRLIAIFEGGKALLILICLLVFILDFHLNAHDLAKSLVSRLHVDSHGHFVSILLKTADDFNTGELIAVCICALMYSIIKFSESVGLWKQLTWGKALGVISIGVMIPYEIYTTFHHYSNLKLIILSVNTFIVLYLLFIFDKRAK